VGSRHLRERTDDMTKERRKKKRQMRFLRTRGRTVSLKKKKKHIANRLSSKQEGERQRGTGCKGERFQYAKDDS